MGSVLTSFGNTVTVVGTSLPADLSPYDAIWHVGAFVGLTSAQRAQLAAFLAAGGGLHLTGERPCCDAMNATHAALINSVVSGGGVVVGGLGDHPQPFTFNAGALGVFGTGPNVLTTWTPASPGGMGGLAAANVLVSANNGTPVGAVFDESNMASGAGRLTILMDVNWMSSSGLSLANNRTAAENVIVFLLGAASPNPLAKDDCKKGGREQYGFRNQGQCVRFIETGKDSRT